MQWLALSIALSVGMVPSLRDYIVPSENKVVGVEAYNAFFLTVSPEITLFDFMKIYGDIESYAYDNKNGLTYFPFRIDYVFGAAVFYDSWEFGVWHECDHGVEYTSGFKPWYAKSETKIYLTFRKDML